jgi:hypothetical protein
VCVCVCLCVRVCVCVCVCLCVCLYVCVSVGTVREFINANVGAISTHTIVSISHWAIRWCQFNVCIVNWMQGNKVYVHVLYVHITRIPGDSHIHKLTLTHTYTSHIHTHTHIPLHTHTNTQTLTGPISSIVESYERGGKKNEAAKKALLSHCKRYKQYRYAR